MIAQNKSIIFIDDEANIFFKEIKNIKKITEIYQDIMIGFVIPNKEHNLFITPDDKMFDKEILEISNSFDISIFLITPYENNDFLPSFCDKVMIVTNNK